MSHHGTEEGGSYDALAVLELLARQEAPERFTELLDGARAAGLAEPELHQLERAVQLATGVRHSLARHDRREAGLDALTDTARDLTLPHDVDGLLRVVVRRAKRLLDLDLACLTLRDDHGARVLHSIEGAVGPIDPATCRGALGEHGLGGLVHALGTPAWTEDYLADERFSHHPDVDAVVRDEGLRAVLAVPLRAGDAVLGLLYGADRRPRRYTAGELALVASLADLAAVATEKARLLDHTRAEVTELERDSSRARTLLARMRYVGEAHGRIMNLILAGGDLLGVAKAAGDALDACVLIRDTGGRTLAAAGEILHLDEEAVTKAALDAHAGRRPVLACGRAGPDDTATGPGTAPGTGLGTGLALGFGPEPGFAREPGFGPEPGFAREPGFGPEPGFDRESGFARESGPARGDAPPGGPTDSRPESWTDGRTDGRAGSLAGSPADGRTGSPADGLRDIPAEIPAEAPAGGLEECLAEDRPCTRTWVAPVIAGSEDLGVLVVRAATPLTCEDERLLALAAQSVAFLLLMQRSTAVAEGPVRDELLDDLLAEPQHAPQQIAQRTRRLGIDLRKPHLMVVARPEGGEQGRAVVWASSYAYRLGGLKTVQGGCIVLLLPGVDASAAAKAVSAELGPLLGHPVSVGAAGPGWSADSVGRLYQQAMRCLDAMSALGGAGAAASVDDLGFLGLLLSDDHDVDGFIESAIGPVLDYDAERFTDLTRTLEAYFASGASPTNAAEALHVHPNTVSRRLERIGELLGPEWQKPGQVLEVQLALRLQRTRDVLARRRAALTDSRPPTSPSAPPVKEPPSAKEP
ncbi:helix-turn-helix domain-containing protein [Streptomyces sp. NPDC053493]|uniref:helix-turn-helix domain-containing protein n=1 Tax=Streptomyces sp. NPDC053493 TaxID=3365705 RepID=UPI0037CFCA29